MRKLAATVLTVVLGVGAVTVMDGPAVAGTGTGSYVRVSATNVSVPAGKCGTARFAATPTQAFADWDATLVARGPGGGLAEYEDMSPSHTSFKDQFCSYFHERTGVYTVKLHFTGYDADDNVVAKETVTTTFRYQVLPKLRARLVVRARHVRHGFWTIDGVLKRQGKGWARQNVRIEAKFRGDWYKIKSKYTHKDGSVHWTARPEPQARRFPLRLHFAGSDTTKATVSKTFHIYP